MEPHLTWNVLVKPRQALTRDLPFVNEALNWVANSATLISGERDAVLVDTFLTIDQSKELADWVAASEKNLTAIYITHAHGDHFLGLDVLLDRFPNAKALATPEVVDGMSKQLAGDTLETFWKVRFPGQLSDAIIIPEKLQGDGIELEGQQLVVRRAGHSDTADSTFLYIPSLDLVVAGDVLYNGIHLFQGETDAANRLNWIAAIDAIDRLHPQTVIAGHKRPTNDDSPTIIDETRSYLRDFIRLDGATTTARDLYDRMIDLYPDRANPGSLWGAAVAAKAAPDVTS